MASTMRFDRWEDTLGNSVNMTQVSGGSGLVPVIPSSVTVGSGTSSISSNGKVTFTGVSKISFDNTFTNFENYKIVIKIATATAGSNLLQFRYRAGGSETVGTSYYMGGSIGWHTGTTAAWSIQGGAQFPLCPINNSSNWGQATIEVSPGIDGQFPKLTGQGGGESSSTNFTGATVFSGINTIAGAKDGFAVFPDGGTITGYMKIYGYR